MFGLFCLVSIPCAKIMRTNLFGPNKKCLKNVKNCQKRPKHTLRWFFLDHNWWQMTKNYPKKNFPDQFYVKGYPLKPLKPFKLEWRYAMFIGWPTVSWPTIGQLGSLCGIRELSKYLKFERSHLVTHYKHN